MSDDFDKCVRHSTSGGLHRIECLLGFWAVEGSDKTAVLREARHYFRQYRGDGEYHMIIGGPALPRLYD